MKFKELSKKIKKGIIKIGSMVLIILVLNTNTIILAYDNYDNINKINYTNEVDNLKTQNGFTLFDNIDEFSKWLNKQNVSRKITRLQLHHMDLPNYNTWNGTDKRVYGNNRELGRTKSLDDYGKRTWNYSDGHGHYIAQHFNVFPNGKITTGRNLNSTPIGIKGWNTNAICVEIYGDFDKGADTMTSAQKKAVIALYGELCKRFKLTPSTNTIRPHCWFTAGGTYLGKYDSSRSAKTCPGTNFMGYGCSQTGFSKFINEVKKYVNGEDKVTETKVNQTALVNVENALNVRKTADASSTKLGSLKNNTKVTIVAKCSNGWYKIKYGDGYGYVNGKYLDNIKTVEDTATSTKKTYYRVVTGSYSDRDNAVSEQNKLKKIGYDAFLITATTNGKTIFRVIAESLPNKKEAEKLVAELKKKGFDSFILPFEA